MPKGSEDKMTKIATYKIQDWLFSEADGNFNIDLAESGIQFKSLHDLSTRENYPLNYSLDRGDDELRRILAELYDVELDQVMVTHGSQEALYLFYRSYLKAGDHVITFKPGWQQSWEVPINIGASVTAIQLRAENNYNISIDEVKNAINDNTRLLILNFPNNPTGASIDDYTLDALVDLCNLYGVRIINDEEYLTDYKKSVVTVCPESCSVSSLSKVYGFPGLRTGWFIGPKEIVKDLVNYRRYTTVSNSYLCEKLACQILKEKRKYIDYYDSLSREGLFELKKWTCKYPSLKLIEPQGTPFAYIAFPTSIDTNKFSRHLLAREQVLVMPAEVFEDKNAIRISFGRPLRILKTGLERITNVLEQLL